MDAKQFKDFTDEWKNKGAFDYTRKSHYEQMAPLFEAHAEVVTCTVEDFHNLGTQGDVTTYYPKKETIDKFGAAAGLYFASVNVGTRKDSPLCFVGKAQCRMLGPDGQMIDLAPAEYEYDAEVRAEEEILSSLKKWGTKSKFDKSNPKSDIERRSCEITHRKVARRRADTGARSAATIAAIGMSTGFKDLFAGGKKEVYFLFSRVIYNAKNKMVMDYALHSMFGSAQLLGGENAAAIEDKTNGDELENVEDMKSANMPEENSAQIDTASMADEAGGFTEDEMNGASDAFGEVETVRQKLQTLRDKYDAQIPAGGKALIDPALANEDTPEDKLKNLYGRTVTTLKAKGINV